MLDNSCKSACGSSKLKKIRKSKKLVEKKEDKTGITITSKAKKQILLIAKKKQSNKNNNKIIAENVEQNNLFLRIMIEVGGCAGMKYHLIIDDYISNEDFVIKTKDITMVAVDPYSMNYLNGANLDYYETLEGSGFKVTIPDATVACSCGNSFGCGR